MHFKFNCLKFILHDSAEIILLLSAFVAILLCWTSTYEGIIEWPLFKILYMMILYSRYTLKEHNEATYLCPLEYKVAVSIYKQNQTIKIKKMQKKLLKEVVYKKKTL